MSVNFSPCVLIPCYNHGAMMPGVLARLKPFNLPCIVVDDGSDAATQQQLDNLVAEQPGVTLIRLAENAGKGAAVMRGLQAAESSPSAWYGTAAAPSFTTCACASNSV